MSELLAQVGHEAKRLTAEAKTLDELDAVRVLFFGRKGIFRVISDNLWRGK